MSVTVTPGAGPSEETILRDKLSKKDPGAQDFFENAERSDVDGLKKLIVDASNTEVEAMNAMNANDNIQQLKESLKQEAGPFRDTMAIQKLRRELVYKLLEAKGVL